MDPSKPIHGLSSLIDSLNNIIDSSDTNSSKANKIHNVLDLLNTENKSLFANAPAASTLSEIAKKIKPFAPCEASTIENIVMAITPVAEIITDIQKHALDVQISECLRECSNRSIYRLDRFAAVLRATENIRRVDPSTTAYVIGAIQKEVYDLTPEEALKLVTAFGEILTQLNLNPAPKTNEQLHQILLNVPNLEKLDIRAAPYHSIDEEGIRDIIQTLPKLAVLKLIDIPIGDGLTQLDNLPIKNSLQELSLHGCNLGPESCKAISGLSKLHTLKITADRLDSRHFAHIATCESLRNLDLTSTGMQASGAQLLSQSNLELQSLNIGGNPLGAEGARAIASLKNGNELTQLNISRCEIGNEGADALAHANFSQLNVLDISYNGIDSKSIQAMIETLSNLKFLNCDNQLPGQNEYFGMMAIEHFKTRWTG